MRTNKRWIEQIIYFGLIKFQGKSTDGLHRIRTQGCRMEGADESAQLPTDTHPSRKNNDRLTLTVGNTISFRIIQAISNSRIVTCDTLNFFLGKPCLLLDPFTFQIWQSRHPTHNRIIPSEKIFCYLNYIFRNRLKLVLIDETTVIMLEWFFKSGLFLFNLVLLT